MNYWKNAITKHCLILLILLMYFSIHLVNLTLLPIFNDESIYLDWAWLAHTPGHLYDSLLDAKQPLMIWIFAIFQNFFADPLFAGRFASVVIGSVTVAGIYVVTKRLLNKRSAVIAALLYSIIPIFVFYNRQALLEAAMGCIGIWSFQALLNLIQKPTHKHGAILGIILGLGFFAKSSSLLFIVAAGLIILFSIFKKRKIELVKSCLTSLVLFFCVNFILFINPVFWQTFSTNNRYSFTLTEIFTFPFASWFNHLLGFFEIGFIFVTPLVFLFSIIGIFMMKKEKIKNAQLLFVYFFLAILMEIFSARFQHQRYLVPFLPFLVVPASYVISILWIGDIAKKLVAAVSFLIPLVLTLTLIFNPEFYIIQASKISKYSDVGYVRGQTSGYGIKETMQYIKEHSLPSQPTLVLFALNSGNPENAVSLYSQRDPQLYALRIDSKVFPEIEQYVCLTSKYPAFFVTRYDQRVGMDRYFVLEKSFPNPDGKYFVGIYTLKKKCNGKTLSLSDFYQGAIDKIAGMR